MVLDGITRRNLELTQTIRECKRKGSLLGILDHTCSSMGGRLIKRWIEQPLKEIEAIDERIEAVSEMYDQAFLRSGLRAYLA